MSRAPIRTMLARGTRLKRSGAGEAPLEAVAAEFALLAQRRARVARQIELLERQRTAAAATLRMVESRLAGLSRRMRVPGDGTAAPALPEPPAPQPATPAQPAPRAGRRGLVIEY